MPKPEIRRLVLADGLLTALVRERKLDLVLEPDVARDDWPKDMKLTRVEWDGGRIVATLEAEAWPVAGDWFELLYRPASDSVKPLKEKPPEELRHMGEIWSDANV